MAGVKGLVSLALLASIGLTFIIIACALPAFNNKWWPMFVFIFYALCPIPTMIARKYTDSAGGASSPCMEIAIFLTMGLVVSSFGLPIVMARTGAILAGACYFTLAGNIVVYLTLIAYFAMDESDYTMW